MSDRFPSAGFDPLAEATYPKADGEGRELTEVARRQQALEASRASYNEGLRFRVSGAQVSDTPVTWTPSIINRDQGFRRQLPGLIVAALRTAGEREKQQLEKFFVEAVGDTAGLNPLLRQGMLPPSLAAHFIHPLRGGGRAVAKNLCIMTVDARAMLKNTRVTPVVQDRYNLSLTEIQKRAARYLANPDVQCIPPHFIKSVAIGCPLGTVVLNDDDIRLHRHSAYLQAEGDAIEALKQMHDTRERRPHKPQARTRGRTHTPR